MKKNHRTTKIITIIFSLMIITGSWALYAQNQSRNYNPAKQSRKKYNPQTDSIILQHEFRGAWVTTVSSTDWPKNKIILSKISEDESDKQMKKRIERQRDSQKTAIVELFEAIKDAGCNAVMFQVCCNADAMWNSSILPWATQLTGVQGENPGYDPLEFATKTAHNLGLEIHAWLNPMRIGFVENKRAENHPHKLHPELVQTVGGRTMYWDPANPEVIEYLSNLCKELMINYELDGLHIDDYFYPEGLKAGKIEGWDDSALYEKYGDTLSLEKWREKNVNNIIRAMYEAVHSSSDRAIFSVSPGGRLINTQNLYADPQYWIEEGTIDFLAPQIYWQHGHKIADFKMVLDSWKDIMKDIPCVPGLAAYRWGEKNAFEYLSEYDLQIKELREAEYVNGHIWFTTGSILRPEFADFMRENFYQHPSLTPNYRKDYISKSLSAPTLSINGKSLHWNAIAGATSYAIYELECIGAVRDRETRSEKVIWRANLHSVVSGNHNTKLEVAKGKKYTVLACDGKDRSELSNVVELD